MGFHLDTVKNWVTAMRDELQQVVIDAINDSEGNSEKITDAILAAIPAMIEAGIPDLVWEAEDGNPTCEDAQGTGIFYRVLHRLDGMGLLRINGSRNGETVHVTVEAAKSAANDHNRATLMAAIGMGEA